MKPRATSDKNNDELSSSSSITDENITDIDSIVDSHIRQQQQQQQTQQNRTHQHHHHHHHHHNQQQPQQLPNYSSSNHQLHQTTQQHHKPKKKSTSIFNKKPYLSKKISSKSHLESIRENSSPAGTASSNMSSFSSGVTSSSAGTTKHAGRSSSGCFGIRSYLHEFYEHRHSNDTLAATELDFLIRQRRKSKRLRMLWWISAWTSVIGLVLGVSLLLVGYFSEPMRSTSSLDKDKANEFNYILECSRVFGLIVFSVAGVALVLCLLIASFCDQHQCFSLDNSSIFEDDQITTSINLSPGPIVTSNNSNLFKSGNMDYQVVEPQSFKLN